MDDLKVALHDMITGVELAGVVMAAALLLGISVRVMRRRNQSRLSLRAAQAADEPLEAPDSPPAYKILTSKDEGQIV